MLTDLQNSFTGKLSRNLR